MKMRRRGFEWGAFSPGEEESPRCDETYCRPSGHGRWGLIFREQRAGRAERQGAVTGDKRGRVFSGRNRAAHFLGPRRTRAGKTRDGQTELTAKCWDIEVGRTCSAEYVQHTLGFAGLISGVRKH